MSVTPARAAASSASFVRGVMRFSSLVSVPSISSAMALMDMGAFPFRSESVVAKKSDRLGCRPLKSGQEARPLSR